LLLAIGCDAPAGETPSRRPMPEPLRAADAAIAVDATLSTQPVPPSGCVPAKDIGWICPSVVLATAGSQAIVCFIGHCADDDTERVCMLVDPRSGNVVAAAEMPTPQFSEDAPSSRFELVADDRDVNVCANGRCTRMPKVLPAGKRDLDDVAIDERGAQLFIIDGNYGTAYDVATKRRVGRVNLALPSDQPPPPGSDNDLAYWGRSLLLGDFDEPGTFERALDPASGKTRWLTKPWARLPGHLLVHFDWDGRVDLFDFDASLARVASRKAGAPRNAGEGVSGYILRVGNDALVVTEVPPATLFVDSKARTISKPRRLAGCR
jgi:hypothetical protein